MNHDHTRIPLPDHCMTDDAKRTLQYAAGEGYRVIRTLRDGIDLERQPMPDADRHPVPPTPNWGHVVLPDDIDADDGDFYY